MSVVKGERKESSVEFDATYFKVYNDAVRLITNKFGGNKDKVELYSNCIKYESGKIMSVVSDIGKQIRIANSIFPVCKLEYEQRRLSQDIAIGLCYDLLTKYQIIMQLLEVNENKYVEEIKTIMHEINCLKKWRASDNKRYKNIG